MNATLISILVPVIGLVALLYAFSRTRWIDRQDTGTDVMRELSDSIAEGARTFLNREYRVLVIFVVVVAVILGLAYQFGRSDSSWLVAVAFIVGAFCSGLAGYIGMNVATQANVRTTQAARTGLAPAMNVAFSGGLVMGLSVVGLGVLGLGGLYVLFDTLTIWDTTKVVGVITGFSMGASSIALFARVGGGIYTKAADVGADLAGKVVEDIPEDDPRNPATIADNVGDNVGDVAGMGADLFESFVGSIIGAMVLGTAFIGVSEFAGAGSAFGDLSGVLLPLVLAGVGIIVAMLGAQLVRVEEGGDPQNALNTGEFGAAAVMAVASYFVITWMLPAEWTATVRGDQLAFTNTGVFWAVMLGLAAGLLIGLITEYYTATDNKPVVGIAEQSVTGTATNIIAGLGVGMYSTGIPAVIIAVAIVGAYSFAGLYGIAIAAVGMLSITGIQLAVDAYGPISDNAGGLAEMSELPGEVRGRTDKLDAVGNTTAAIGKGFAIGSAALTALALFAAFMQQANVESLDVAQPLILAGVLIGAMLPYVFSAMTMGAVGRAAGDMIVEVGRQFDELDGLREGKQRPNYTRCVDISTKAALREMVTPGLLAVLVPVAIGFLSPQMLGGLLAGLTVSGVLFAIFQSNAGGAWDNAKKRIESDITVDGATHGKGSDAHKASVVGDTVGDPLKDTSGPSLNILIKLVAVVSLVIAPLIAVTPETEGTADEAGAAPTEEQVEQPPAAAQQQSAETTAMQGETASEK
jgi:K(+)-stimulated pyrophosphate-energized sodium pump